MRPSKQFPRSQLSLEKLKDFFEKQDLKNITTQNRRKFRKHAEATLWFLDQGLVRVWDPHSQTVNVWVKQAILTYFRTAPIHIYGAGCFEYWDKLPVKTRASFKDVRVVPGAVIRFGSFLEPGTICMPSFVNIGAYVGKGTLIDTWATVGSCAQVGQNVHISGGVGIGGVLEPAQAAPVIVEDGVFLGSRVILVEGVQVGEQAVLGAGVVLTASTKIVDVREKNPQIFTGRIPPRSVVIPGVLPKTFPAGEYGVPCALIIGSRSASTDLKTSLNGALREYGVAA